METTNTELDKRLERSVERVLMLGRNAVTFAQTERAPRYLDGRRENDAEHSHMLVVVTLYLADEYYPELNPGLIAQFGTVHDFPEIYTGDVPTLGISDADREAKEAAEKISTERLLNELPEPLRGLLERYEQQIEPEARFVRLVDKLLPLLVQIYGDGRRTFSEQYGITEPEQLTDLYLQSTMRLQSMFPEFPLIIPVREKLTMVMNEEVFGK